jgi:hypothetical protein
MMANIVETKHAVGRLEKATNGWTTPVIMRTYEGKQATAEFETEAFVLALRGYEPDAQTADGGHIHAGRILLTGGLSIFAGSRGIRSQGTTTVTYKKVRAAQGPHVAVVVDDAKRGFAATSNSQAALAVVADFAGRGPNLDELPTPLLSGIPDVQAEAVVAFLAKHGVTAHIERPAPAESPETSALAEGAEAPHASNDLASQIQALAALHKDGILTDDEFAAAKTRLIGGGAPAQ